MAKLEKVYNPKETEDKWYNYWEKHKFFHAKANPNKKPYTIVIPPPNITGILTMGHVLNNTIQDVFIRWKRMQGYETLWMPGTDHAGIATQNVVEKALLKEGITRHQLGREKFLERVWKWKEEYGGTIIKQLKKLGASCDWERERFTMDEGLSEAVQEVFIRLYNKGLIYKGKYIVNWCPKDHTAISDDEVNHTEQNGHLWYIKYPFIDSKDFVTVATTRPETMLGDTAVAVNPNDERYKHLIGRYVILPLVERKIPIIADEFVDPAFGTGMVKVTPAHDPNDYWIGIRHNLEQINIFDISANLNDNAPIKYRGKDRFEVRMEVVRDLESLGLIEKIEPHTHAVGRCYRCNTIIEPYLSDQWFIKMKPLAEPALSVVLNGTIKFHPDRWVKVYEHWMTNIRDWCISRQLWWGHRIPVWYCDNCNEIIASKKEPVQPCPKCGNKTFHQDEDVLDTWASSWLWPFSTLGWPNDNEDLRYFYPTDTLVTGPDIIFFWVARMIMAAMEFAGEIPLPNGSKRTKDEEIVPFKNVYFTSIIRDAQGRKMSKSLGNSPDPLDVIEEYGADALRFTILYLAPLGQDVLYSNEKCEIGRNFANKIWNAGRFLLMNAEQIPNFVYKSSEILNDKDLDLSDKWILSKLNSTISELNDSLENFYINNASKILYDFIWHDYCDWYLEMIKSRLYGIEKNSVKTNVLERAFYIYEQILKMLHPFMPFVTEEIWQNIADRKPGESIMVSKFPECANQWINKDIERDASFMQNVVNAIRTIRGELNVPLNKEITILMNFHKVEDEKLIKNYEIYLKRLTKASEVVVTNQRPKHSASSVVDNTEIYIPLEGIIDLETEKNRIQKEIDRINSMLQGIEKKLSNPNFIEKAPQEIVESEKKKRENFNLTLSKLRKNLEYLS
ncbi:MAG: Valyl-tRNA synthetase [Ignavibacteriae bacterium]|nr:MAG: Valyl-tRNA synthetase [Ignavibacteriota bacterium]